MFTVTDYQSQQDAVIFEDFNFSFIYRKPFKHKCNPKVLYRIIISGSCRISYLIESVLERTIARMIEFDE